MAVPSRAALPFVLIPGFAGLPWDTAPFGPWHHRILVTGKLPDLATLDAYATALESWTVGLPRYVLVGDSFGALIALTASARKPSRLGGLVLSGAFQRADLEWTRAPRLAAVEGDVAFHQSLERSLTAANGLMGSVTARREAIRLIEAGCGGPSFARRAALALAFDAQVALEDVDVPVLVIRPTDVGYFFRLVEQSRYAATVEAFMGRLDEGHRSDH